MNDKTEIAKFVPQGGEAAFIAALRAGGDCRFDKQLPEAERTLRGNVLSTILRGEALSEWNVIKLPRVIAVSNVRIEGVLDLSEHKFLFTLAFWRSEFSEIPNFTGSEFVLLALRYSNLPGVRMSDLNLQSHLRLDGSVFTGEVDAAGIVIGGQLNANNAKFCVVSTTTLNLQEAEVRESILLMNIVSRGSIELEGIKVGGHVLFTGASLLSFFGPSVILDYARISKTLRFDALAHLPIGGIDLRSAKANTVALDSHFMPISGANILGLTYHEIQYDDGIEGNKVWEGWLASTESVPSVKYLEVWRTCKLALEEHFLQHSMVTVEQGKASEVFKKADYERGDVRSRMLMVSQITRLLSVRQKFTPGPWRQYAKVLDEAGNEVEARRVRTELARRMTKLNVDRMSVQKNHSIKISLYRAWRFVFKTVSDYGLMPVKSLYWGIGLLGLGWLIFYLNYPDMVLARERVYMTDAYSYWKHGDPLPAGYPNFNPFIYALDVMLPIVDFAQESHWRPRNVEHWFNPLRWYNRIHLALGWFLSTIFVLGFTGLIRDKKGA